MEFGGENWDGLKKCVESSQMACRKQVLDIIDNVPDVINYVTDSSRKKALMDLKGGDPYRYMLREYFPSLRKAVCSIDFEVQNFDVDKAREIVKTKPQNLSLNEIFLVANTYEKGSHEFTDLFETAVRLYPDDLTANLNAASAALARKDLVLAEKYLNKLQGRVISAEYYNAKGVLYMLKGDYTEAEEWLDKAFANGLPEAKHNLEEINNKKKNINEINSSK